MVIFSERGYRLQVTVYDQHALNATQTMARAIAADLSRDRGYLNLQQVELIEIDLREEDLTHDNLTWSAKIFFSSESTTGESTMAEGSGFVSIQNYKAIHKTNHNLDYAGRFGVQVTIREIDGAGKSAEVIANMICSLLHTYYRERIYDFFPDWETDYIDKIAFYGVADDE